MNALEFLHLQLELECKRVTAEGVMAPLSCDDPDEIPRLFVARHAQGWTVYFRHDVEPSVQRQLCARPPEQLWAEPEIVYMILPPEKANGGTSWRGRTYHFATSPSLSLAADVVEHDGTFVILEDGQPVARAWSSRMNERAAELALETLPRYRRRGYAYQVAVAWAAQQLKQQKVAFYSHLAQNDASQALAAKLEVTHLFDAVGYE